MRKTRSGGALGRVSGRRQGEARRASTRGHAVSSRTSRAGRRRFSGACRSAGSATRFERVTAAVNVGDLEIFAAGTNVDESALAAHGLVRGRFDRIKVLGDGELTKAVTVSAHAFSKSAAEKSRTLAVQLVLARERAALRAGPCPHSPLSQTSARFRSSGDGSFSRSCFWPSTGLAFS